MDQYEQQEEMNEKQSANSLTPSGRLHTMMQAMKRHTKVFAVTGLITIMTCLGAGIWFVYDMIQDKILPEGYVVAGMEVGGLDVQQARELLHTRLNAWAQTSVSFLPDRTDDELDALTKEVFSLQELGVKFTAVEANAVFKEWEQGGFWAKLRLKRELEHKKHDTSIQFDAAKLEQVLIDTYGQLINRVPVDAQVDYTQPLQPVYAKEHDGVELDHYMLIQQLQREVEKHILYKEPGMRSITVRMPLVTLPAQVTVDALEKRKPNALLAEFRTAIADVGKGHYHNVTSSANVLNDWVISPGESVKYQDIADKTREEYGLEKAPVIEKGKFIDGIGGGLCQTSTTMYNAALQSGLDIVERHSHSLPVGYVPLGRDATYSDNGPDLIVRNNTDGDVVWKTSTTKDTLVIRVYGQREPGVTYEIETQTVKEMLPSYVYELKDVSTDQQTHVVQQGKKGYVVESYRIKKVNGVQVSREKLRTSNYRSQPTRMTVENTQPVHVTNMP